jgi:hypothetical protein
VTAFAWMLEDATGDRRPCGHDFVTREEAEAWLAEAFGSLLDEGGERVVLTRDGEVVYRMSLKPDE